MIICISRAHPTLPNYSSLPHLPEFKGEGVGEGGRGSTHFRLLIDVFVVFSYVLFFLIWGD